MKDALRLLSNNTEGGVLNLSEKITCGNTTMTVLKVLKNKHPEGKALLRSTVLRTTGSAGPSG